MNKVINAYGRICTERADFNVRCCVELMFYVSFFYLVGDLDVNVRKLTKGFSSMVCV